MASSMDSSIMLVVSQGDSNSSGDEDSVQEVEAGMLAYEDWESLVAMAYHVAEIRIRVDRDVLSNHSTYFRSYRNFREAEWEIVQVEFYEPIFCSLLQCIHGYQPCLSSSMIAPLIQGATYFGVEKAIKLCRDWADSTMCKGSWGAEDGFLVNLLSIWHSALDNGVHSIGELCVKALAINFAEAALSENFVDLPFHLLKASIDHPELTVQSERQLCEALLLWYENQEQGPPREDSVILFKKIQLSLLPIEYFLRRLLGKYSLDMFELPTISRHSDAEIRDFIVNSRDSGLAFKPVRETTKLKTVIRISEHLQELDLSGCQQITFDLLLSSSAQTPKFPKYKVLDCPVNWIQKQWPDIPVFENLKKLNLSQCWRIDGSLLPFWLRHACPNITELRLSNCPQFQAITIPLVGLQRLSILDLSVPEEVVEIDGAVTRRESILLDISPLFWDMSKFNIENDWVELSLRGRSEITDIALICITRNCLSLTAVDLSGCSELSDGGIASFLKLHLRGFKKFCAAGTNFGPASCQALLSKSPTYPGNHHLETLDIEKCSVLSSEHHFSLLQALPSLVSLSLAFTHVDDNALSAFSGTSLQHLNLRETKISGEVFAHILGRNPGMKSLNIRGCTKLALYKYDTLPMGRVYGWKNIEAGWGISDSNCATLGFASHDLQSLVLGVGGTLSEASLLHISEQCPELKRLSLCFQVISDEGLSCLKINLKHLQTLELQDSSLFSRNLLIDFLSTCGSNLTKLRLERVTPWLADSDIDLLSQCCTGLQSLSLLGCQFLTTRSILTITTRWRSLQELKLEDCHNIITCDNALLLIKKCQALQVLHLRHIGKGLSHDFIPQVSLRLPLMQKLAIDLCDAVDDKFTYPARSEVACLKAVYINRCKSDKHAFHRVSGAGSTEASSQYYGRIHKDTKVLEWNPIRLKQSVVNERLTFD